MAEPVAFPLGMRRMGWVLAAMMLLYPIDYFMAEWATRDMVARDRVTAQSSSASTGLQFDLHSMAMHCGPVGWAGAWAFLIGSVWVLVAAGLWLYYRWANRSLSVASYRALVATAVGVAVVLSFMIIESNR